MVSTMLLDPYDIAIDHQQMAERVVGIMRTSVDVLSLDNLAESAGLSPFYFARTFRTIVGVPPGEFQAALRFEKAKELLLTTPASVTDICFEVGYDSLGTFSSRFKKLIGIGPAQFRALPEIVAGMSTGVEITRNLSISPSAATVQGTISVPGETRSHIYVGLFTDHIAATRPIVGQLLPEPGAFLLPNVPPGTYYLMAAALPNAGTPMEHLLPGPGVFVGGTDPVVIITPNEHHFRNLTLRPMSSMDPPLLTALPALVL